MTKNWFDASQGRRSLSHVECLSAEVTDIAAKSLLTLDKTGIKVNSGKLGRFKSEEKANLI